MTPRRPRTAHPKMDRDRHRAHRGYREVEVRVGTRGRPVASWFCDRCMTGGLEPAGGRS